MTHRARLLRVAIRALQSPDVETQDIAVCTLERIECEESRAALRDYAARQTVFNLSPPWLREYAGRVASQMTVSTKANR